MSSKKHADLTECPRCGGRYQGPPAISRTDNATPICNACGTAEALHDHLGSLTPQTAWVSNR